MKPMTPDDIEEIVNTYDLGDISVQTHIVLSPIGNMVGVYSRDYKYFYNILPTPQDGEVLEKMIYVMVKGTTPRKIYYN